MKTYVPCAVKWFALLTAISAAILVMGIICMIINAFDIGLQVLFTLFGGFMTVLFISCFFAAKSRYLTMDQERIVLPRGVEKNGIISFRRTVVPKNEIRSIGSVLRKGDGILAKDTLFHILTLKDGTRIMFTLYSYGKDAEHEILDGIKNTFR